MLSFAAETNQNQTVAWPSEGDFVFPLQMLTMKCLALAVRCKECKPNTPPVYFTL